VNTVLRETPVHDFGLPIPRASTSAVPEAAASLAFHADRIGSQQSSAGEIKLLQDKSPFFGRPRYVHTVFGASVQATLTGNIRSHGLDEVSARSCRFVYDQMLPDGTWSFFGAGTPFPPDIDDTFFALTSLGLRGTIPHAQEQALAVLQRLPSEDGLYLTYFSRTPNPCDLTVNANILLCLAMLRVSTGQYTHLRDRLISALEQGDWLVSSGYYVSPLSFLFSVTWALALNGDGLPARVRLRVSATVRDMLWRRTASLLELAQGIHSLACLETAPDSDLLQRLVALPNEATAASPWFRRRSRNIWYGAPAADSAFVVRTLLSCLTSIHMGTLQWTTDQT